jgi:hypothetical protein
MRQVGSQVHSFHLHDVKLLHIQLAAQFRKRPTAPAVEHIHRRRTEQAAKKFTGTIARILTDQHRWERLGRRRKRRRILRIPQT